MKRCEVLAFFAKLAPCVVAMEACGSVHYWAREIAKLGHETRLIPPAYVKPYVKRGKACPREGGDPSTSLFQRDKWIPAGV